MPIMVYISSASRAIFLETHILMLALSSKRARSE